MFSFKKQSDFHLRVFHLEAGANETILKILSFFPLKKGIKNCIFLVAPAGASIAGKVSALWHHLGKRADIKGECYIYYVRTYNS